MSILAALGASPSSFTTPTIVATVAGSTGVAAAAGAAAPGATGCSSAVSFLPHPASRTSPNNAGIPQTAIHVFVFILSLYLSCVLKANKKQNLFGTAAARACASIAAGRCAAARRSRMPHGRAHAPLLFRGELQDVIHQQPRLILIIPPERRRSRAGEDPVIVFPLEQSGRHGSTRADGLRVNDPAFHPIGF